MQDRPVLGRTLGTDLSQLRLSYVDLSECSFTGAHHLDKLTVDDWHSWRTSPRGLWVTHRVTLADEHRVRGHARWALPGTDGREAPSVDSVQTDYHSLRSMMQDRKDQRAASDFYYGEMEMRRIGLRRSVRADLRARDWRAAFSTLGEWLLLCLYWLLSGYGQRAWRAFVTLGLVVAGGERGPGPLGLPDPHRVRRLAALHPARRLHAAPRLGRGADSDGRLDRTRAAPGRTAAARPRPARHPRTGTPLVPEQAVDRNRCHVPVEWLGTLQTQRDVDDDSTFQPRHLRNGDPLGQVAVSASTSWRSRPPVTRTR